ncbi:MAG TPA: CHRD domain-containing protein [Nitrososphaeraceae archaeon]|nr:CHRD domain-containing protein [Nitrososphaeraceae archaeon]
MITLSCLIIIAMTALLAQLINSYPMVNAANQIDRYWSGLTGDRQIPPVNTDARGYVGLKFDDDLGVFVFTVNAENIGNVTGIYVYKDDKNQDGSVVLDLLKAEKERKINDIKILNVTSSGKLKGTLAAGGVTKDNLQGELKGKPISDFYNLMANGSIYVVVHTKDFPNGEIRGNSFVPMDDLFPADSEINWDKAGNKQ